MRLPRTLLRGRHVIGLLGVGAARALARRGGSARQFVHEIWTPSRFTAAALESLAPGRVRVAGHALACRPPLRPRLWDARISGCRTEAVVVLASFSLASSFERKNPLGAHCRLPGCIRQRIRIRGVR